MSMRELLTPDNRTVIFIDHQPQMTFGVTSIDRQSLTNNVVGLAKSAKAFQVPVILTSVETKSFSGYIWLQLREVFPGQESIERTSMNSWENATFVAEVEPIGRKKLVMAGLWTEVCIVFPALQALAAGYEVYVVEDACGGTCPGPASRPHAGGCVPPGCRTWDDRKNSLAWYVLRSSLRVSSVQSDVVRRNG
jgi:nicotinamidase-related amidase